MLNGGAKMNALQELQTMVQSSGISRAKLTALLREMSTGVEHRTKTKREPSPPCTQYAEIEKVNTCLHCEATHSTVLKLRELEDTVGITKEGKVMIINSNSPAKVECVTHYCDSCYAYIREMTRSELEERYMILLTGQKVPRFFGKLFTKEEREVKL